MPATDPPGRFADDADETTVARARLITKRGAILSLTARGRATYERILPRFQAREEQMVATLSAADRRELDRLLALLCVRSDGWATVY